MNDTSISAQRSSEGREVNWTAVIAYLRQTADRNEMVASGAYSHCRRPDEAELRSEAKTLRTIASALEHGLGQR